MSKNYKRKGSKADIQNDAFDTLYDADIESVLRCCFDANGTLTVYPKGKSMLPTLKEGQDSVELSPVFQLSVNRIYFYKRPNGRFVLHRLLEIKDEKYIFAGDNQLVFENVKKEQILACVSAVYKNNKSKGIYGCGKMFLLFNSNKFLRKLFIRCRTLKNKFFS